MKQPKQKKQPRKKATPKKKSAVRRKRTPIKKVRKKTLNKSILLKPEQLERIADRIRVNFRNFDKNDIS